MLHDFFQLGNIKNGKNIVLDVDETLVFTFDVFDDYFSSGISSISNTPYAINFRDRLYNFSIKQKKLKGKIIGIKRPYLDYFLDFCSKNFENVIVWSAGDDEYVKKICNWIFKGHKYPNHVFTRDDCKFSANKSIKPLSSLSPITGDISLEKTLIVDDKEYTFEENTQNGVLIPKYSPIFDKNILNHDDYLLRFMYWYTNNKISEIDDIKKVNKELIFV